MDTFRNLTLYLKLLCKNYAICWFCRSIYHYFKNTDNQVISSDSLSVLQKLDLVNLKLKNINMSPIHLKKLCFSTQELVKSVGQFIQEQLGQVTTEAIETKSLNSLVSYVDKTAEEKLVSGLQARLEGAVFLTEEATIENQEGEYQWIIDPLDGTTNFLHQIPVFSISVALRHQEEIIMGIVYEVNRAECFYAWKDGGAWLNDRQIQVNSNNQLSDSLIATGFPYYDFKYMDAYFEVLRYFVEHTRGIRRLGSAAVDMAYVACGRFDGFFEYSLNPWDVAAGIILVKEAGGKVCDFYGGENYLFGKSMIVSSDGIHEDFSNIIKNRFEKSASIA